MGIITIQGGTPLRGETVIQGAKNSALPILAASLLSGDVCRIEGCPHLSDVDSAADILRYLGCTVVWEDDDLLVDSRTLSRCDIPQSHHPMGAAVERAPRRYGDDRAACAPHLRTHGAQKLLQIGDLRLPRRVADHRVALCAAGGQHRPGAGWTAARTTYA